MKKFTCILLALILLLACACHDTKEDGDKLATATPTQYI